MKRGTLKKDETDCKKRFVLKKVKKRWVVTGIIFATLVPGLSFAERDVSADDGIVSSSFPTLSGKSLTLPKTARQVTGIVPFAAVSTPTIDNLTDTTQVGESHSATYDNSNYQNAFVVSAAGQSNLAYNKTINSINYTILTPTDSSTTGKTGALAFNQQIDMTKNWTFNFNFDLTRLNSAGGAYLVYNVGDFIGLVLSPTAPNQLAKAGGSIQYGGGLGINGLPNSLSWGIDFYNNSAPQDSNASSYTPVGFGDSSLGINPVGGLLSGSKTGNQVIGWRSTGTSGFLNSANSTTDQQYATTALNGTNAANGNSSYQWSGSGGGPNLTAPVTASYTYNGDNTGTLTVTIPTTSSTTLQTFTRTIPLTTTAMSVGIMAGYNGGYTQMGTHVTSFSLELGTGTTTVNYLDQNAQPLREATSFLANTTDTIGITGGSPNATSDTFAFTAPSFQGYSLVPSGTTDVTVESDTIDNGTTVPGNTLNVQYQGDYQSAPLTAVSKTAGVSVPITLPSSDVTYHGASNQPIAFTSTDTSLTVPGYTYTVTGPDGQPYDTLAAALTANPKFDATTNGYNVTTDKTPQPFVVNYTANNVTVNYGIVTTAGNVDVTTASQLASSDSLTPSQPTIGQTVASSLVTAVTSAPDIQTPKLQVSGIIPDGYHLTGKVYWSKDGAATTATVPTSALTATDVSSSDAATLLFEIAKDYQEANVMISYQNNAQSPTTLTQKGLTGDSFSFNLLGLPLPGYHFVSATDPSGTSLALPLASISGNFDATNNLQVPSDSAPQNYTLTAAADVQQLNVTYNFPGGHDLSNSLTSDQKMQMGTTDTIFSDITVPTINGYTAVITYPDGSTQTSNTITGIKADNTSNGTSQIDSVPQKATVNYVANTQTLTVTYTNPDGTTSTNTIIGTTDGHYDAIDITQISGYASNVSINGGASQIMTSVPAGSFGASPIVINVTYSAWTAQVNYYSQQVDSTGSAIGALTALPGSVSSQTGGIANGVGFGFDILMGTTPTAQTSGLQTVKAIPAGYHVSNFYWSDRPDGTTQDKTPPYHTYWTWQNMTNMASGLVPSYQAAIVYQYTKDVQQADITVANAPSGKGVINGQNTLSDMNNAPYTGVTGGTQVVSVPQINGYLATVTDAAGHTISLSNSQFTITYDATNNGEATTDSDPQNYTITYAPRSTQVLVNYAYASGTNTNVSTSSSVDTAAYTAPSLPQSLEIDSKTDETYSLTVPTISGYDWTVTDSNGQSYTSSTLPSSFTSDGTNITYTVSYTASNATHVIHFYEATYDAAGHYTFTTTPVPSLPAQTVTGPIGSIQTFGVTTDNIQVPSGWRLDPMWAATTSLTGDNDLLNGGDTAKRLTFEPGTTDYIVYLARDIQSVQVNFVNDPSHSKTLYQDGRTAQSYNVPTTNFARSGYDYTITDASGHIVTTIEGTYDDTSNANAGSPIYNTGDGDKTPQVYTVTYTAQTQEAILKTDQSDPANPNGLSYETVKGPTNTAIQFTTVDKTLDRPGYNYNVTVSYTNSDGQTISANYPNLAQALAANATYNNNDVPSGQTDSNPQVFTVSYLASSQTAILQTDATDPTGAQTTDTQKGLTAEKITFLKSDADLVRPGYSYQVKAPNGTSYPSLAAALSADGTYDHTANGTSSNDSVPQIFTVSYTANPLTVNIQYVYGEPKNMPVPSSDFGNQAVPTQVTGITNGTTYTTNVNATATPLTTPIKVPTIPGYTPNVTAVTPKLTVDSSGNPTEPQITVTYTASPDTATISYVDTNGKSLQAYIGSNPTSANGYTDGTIISSAPTVAGYTLSGFKYNGGALDTNSNDLVNAHYTPSADTLEFVYTPNEQEVTIHYLYSTDDHSPKNGNVPLGDFANGARPTETVGGASNTIGSPVSVPTIAGYTASVTEVTPNFAIDSAGKLVTPDLAVTYTANNQNATISYLIAGLDDNGKISLDPSRMVPATTSQTRGAATTAVGVTDQVIGVSAPIIPGYTIKFRTANGLDVSDISQVTFSAPDTPDQLEVIYVPNQQAVKIHYVFQLPDHYDGDYNGITVTADDDNGQKVPGLDTQTLNGYSNGPSVAAPLPTVATDWKVTPASQTVDWTIGSDGSLNTTDYYYYVSPETNQITINYTADDQTDLMGLIHANNLTPILSSEVLTGSSFTTSGAIPIPGYQFKQYTYNGITDTNPPSTTMKYEPDQDVLEITYTPKPQTVDINYIYDPNDGSAKNGGITTANTPTWNPSASQLSQTSVSNGVGQEITVPDIPGYTPNVKIVNPSFAINTDGSLVTQMITVTYTANQNNLATMQYVDTDGNDLSQYASTPVSLNASGTTDQVIPTSGTVEIPGYTFKEIDYIPVNGSPSTNTTIDQLIFSGGGMTTPDQVKFVYTANQQKVNEHYVYSGGGFDGQEIHGLTPGVIWSTSNHAPTTSDPAPDAPVGYALVKSGLDSTGSQPVMWTTVNGQLITPDIYFYYQAQVTQATVNYTTSNGDNDLNGKVPTGTVTGEVKGQTDAKIPITGAVAIDGYSFSNMTVNGTVVATTEAAANAITATFKPNAAVKDKTRIEYLYIPDSQSVLVKFIDASGNPIVEATGQAIPDVTLSGKTNAAIDYTSITDTYTGYTLKTDGRTTTTTYDANDQVNQVVYMIYQPDSQKVNVTYQDASGKTLKAATSLTGLSNGVIDYASIDTMIPGYTLIKDDRNATPRYDTDPATDQHVALVYQANHQQVIVNFKLSQDGGKTWLNLTKSVTLSGDSNDDIDYQALKTAYPGYKLIDDSQEKGNKTFDTADGVNQMVNLYYAPLKQVAVLQTDATDPDNSGGQALMTTTDGYSFGALKFATNSEQNLSRKGFIYKVYGPDGVWYDTLANALAANATYDGTPTNTEAIDTTVPQGQSLKLNRRASIMKSVVPTDPKIDPNQPGDIAGDDVPQVFTASYTPLPESMVVQTVHDPAGNKVYPTATGLTGLDDDDHPIAKTSPLYQTGMHLSLVPKLSGFYNVNVVDTQLQTAASGLPNLTRDGFTYVVKAPDGTEYPTLQAATNAVHVFDNDPSTNQIFHVIYTAQLQTVNIVSDSSDPKGAQTIETAHGPSDSNISLNSNDSNLKRSGYTYQVTGPDANTYNTLAEALKYNPTYDDSDIPSTGIDPTPQNFTVHYTAVEQTANLIVSDKTLETVTGKSDSKLTFKTTDKDLHKSGYTYQVTASNGDKYNSLSEALKAVSTYDHNDLTDGKDETPQNFTVKYTAVKQTANLIVDGKTVETTTGDSDSTLSFKATDKDLHKSGYTYKVTAPNGKTYGTLSEALKVISVYDHNDLTKGKDASPQNFIVVYAKNKDGGNPFTPNNQNQNGSDQDANGNNFGNFGEIVQQYGLLGAIILTLAILSIVLKKILGKKDKK